MENIQLLDYSKCCRLCLTPNTFSTAIFGILGKELLIDVKIHTCLPVKVAEDDGLPVNICYKCLCYLDNFYNFWNACLKADEQLRNVRAAEEHNKADLNSVHSDISFSSADLDFQVLVESDDSEDGMPVKKIVPVFKRDTSHGEELEVAKHSTEEDNRDEKTAGSIPPVSTQSEVPVTANDDRCDFGRALDNTFKTGALEDDSSSDDDDVPKLQLQMDYQFDIDSDDLDMTDSCNLFTDNLNISCKTNNEQLNSYKTEATIPTLVEQCSSHLYTGEKEESAEIKQHDLVVNSASSSLKLPELQKDTGSHDPEVGIKRARQWLSQMFPDKSEHSNSSVSTSQQTLFSFRSRNSSEDTSKPGNSNQSSLSLLHKNVFEEDSGLWLSSKLDSSDKQDGLTFTKPRAMSFLDHLNSQPSSSSYEHYSDSTVEKSGNTCRNKILHNSSQEGSQLNTAITQTPNFTTWYKNTQTAFPHWPPKFSDSASPKTKTPFESNSNQ